MITKLWFYNLARCRRAEREKPKSLKSAVWFVLADVYNLFHTYEQVGEKAINPFPSKRRTGQFGSLLYSFREKSEKLTYRVEWFDKTIMLRFDDLTLPCPAEYDKTLRQTYGDYTVFPPDEERVCHGFFDPDRPYTDYAGLNKEQYDALFENYVL